MIKTLPTEALYQELVQISNVHNFLSTGLFQGHSSQHLINAIRFVEHLHAQYTQEFSSREDHQAVVNRIEGKSPDALPGIQGE